MTVELHNRDGAAAIEPFYFKKELAIENKMLRSCLVKWEGWAYEVRFEYAENHQHKPQKYFHIRI